MTRKNPKALVSELTYRCNMHCFYCYNPVNLSAFSASREIDTATWQSVLDQAARLGVLHVHFSGGEPTLRSDLPALVGHARSLGLYVNLITNLTLGDKDYWQELVNQRVNHIQISFQAQESGLNDLIGGANSFRRKMERVSHLSDHDVYVTLNVVLHRLNIEGLEEILHFSRRLGVQKLELAMTQFHGWAWQNRGQLLPSRMQVERAVEITRNYKKIWADEMAISMVGLDYYEKRPKACMHGWGNAYIVVDPLGSALPCHGAKVIPELEFENVRNRSLDWIWHHSPAFNRFRGPDWMPEPCRSCPSRSEDYGGCRCQAYLLTGKADVTDPVCEFSEDRLQVDELIEDILISDKPKPAEKRLFV